MGEVVQQVADCVRGRQVRVVAVEAVHEVAHHQLALRPHSADRNRIDRAEYAAGQGIFDLAKCVLHYSGRLAAT